MQSRFKFGLKSLALIFVLLASRAWGTVSTAHIAEKIISCHGERKNSYDPADTFGQNLNIEIFQTLTGHYRWNLKVLGKTTMSADTNGPINTDGSTVAPNGDEGLIYYRSIDEGVLLKKANGVLSGLFSYIETTFNKEFNKDEYYLVEYELANCRLTGVKIDQREANIYNAKAELSDLAVSVRPYWLNGAGVIVNDYGLAQGIGIYAQDQDQLDAFISEFVKRRLVKKTATGLIYNYKDASGGTIEIPIGVEITGDIVQP